NPLSVIKSSSQMLAAEANPDAKKAAEFITEEVDRLDGFVRRVLDFSKPCEARLKDVSWTDLVAKLEILVPDELEVVFSRETFACEMDVDLMLQVLGNLVENALKSDAKRVHLTGTKHAIEVADDGHGVPAEVVDRLFEPFVTTRAQGTGLG